MSEIHEIGRTRETDADIIRMLEDALERARRDEIHQHDAAIYQARGVK